MKPFEEISKNNGQYTFSQVADQFGISQPRGQFVPGRFYSLRINPEVAMINESIVFELSEGKSYFDLNPMGLVLFHENWKEVAILLNLKVIPAQVSAKLLEAYYAFSSRNGMQRLYRNGELLPLEERRLLDQPFYMLPQSILSQLLGFSNLYYAINKYNIDQIIEAKLIDWDNFGMLFRPRFETTGLFPEPINMEKVYESFLANSLA